MKNFLLCLAALALPCPALLAQNKNVGIGTVAPESQLHTTGSVRHDTLAGFGTRLLYTDAQGRLFTAVQPGVNAQVQRLPDWGCSTGNGRLSSVVVTGQPTPVASAAIKVRVDITHTYDADLEVFLLSPVGDTLRLIGNNGLAGDNFTNTVFWDGASQSLPIGNATGAPFTGTYKPTGGLGALCRITPDITTFSGIGGGTVVPNGLWQLLAFDNGIGDVGTLNNWSISFDGSVPAQPQAVLADNVVPKNSGGALVAGTLFDVAGNVGVGTATPSAKLDVAGTVNAASFTGDGSTLSNVVNTAGIQSVSGRKTLTAGKLRMTSSGSSDTLSSSGNLTLHANDDAGGTEAMTFAVGNTERMRISADGNLGIGSTNPAGRLDVHGNSSGLLRSIFRNDNTGTSSRQDLQIGANAANLYLGVDNSSAIFGQGVKAYLDNRAGGPMIFGTQGGEAMRIATDGTVGINVIPSGSYQASIYANNPATNGLHVQLNGSSAAYSLKLEHNGSNLIVRPAAAGSTATVVENTAGNLLLNPAADNVGIGTTNPTAKLHTTGSVRFQGLSNGVLYADADGNISSASNAFIDNQNSYVQTADIAIAGVLGIGANPGGSTGPGRVTIMQSSGVSANQNNYGNGIVFLNQATFTPFLEERQWYMGYHTNNNGFCIGNRQRYITVGPPGCTTCGLNDYIDDRLYISSIGRVGIGTVSPTSTLSVNGSADKQGGGSWGSFSDIRLKKSIADYTPGLKEVLAIHPVSFQYNSLSGYSDTTRRFVGVIAQEIEQVLPSTVTIVNNDSVIKDKRQYDGSELTYTLINAIKEQQAAIAALQAKIDALEKGNAHLTAQVKELQQLAGVKPRTAGAKTARR